MARAAAMRRWYKPFFATCVAAIVIARFATWPEQRKLLRSPSNTTVRVERVIDGDTLELVGGDRVRVIGIDTPELDGEPEPYAVEAQTLTRQLVSGRRVRLEFDRERVDKYGRILATVHIDAKCLSEELALAGLGRVMTQFRYSTILRKRLLAAEAQARNARRGIWSEE